MTAVTWRELPPDAPEPPPLSVVRDKHGDWWVHGPLPDDLHWHCIGGALDDATATGARVVWDGVREEAPLQLAEPEGALWPLVESVEPSAYAVRHAALQAAVQLYYGERDDPVEVIGAARAFEGYLRVGEEG